MNEQKAAWKSDVRTHLQSWLWFSPRQRRLSLARRFNAGKPHTHVTRRVATVDIRIDDANFNRRYATPIYFVGLPSPKGLGYIQPPLTRRTSAFINKNKSVLT